MKPEEALYHLIHHAGTVTVPALYRDMPRHLLEALVRECDRPSATERSEAALTRWAQQRLSMPGWAGEREKAKAENAADTSQALVPTEPPPPDEPFTLVDRAIAKSGRLSTPGRRRAAFLRHLARCRTITEAAARTGIDRRTAQRWYNTIPAFAARWRQIVETRRRMATENVVLAADHVEMKPVFYRGRKIAEYTRRDRALDLYLLKQADAETLRLEKRREAEGDFETRVQAEVARRLSEMPRLPRHSATPADDEFTRVSNDFEPADCDIALAR